MKVQVNENYSGIYGCFDEECQTVRAKKAGDPPFIVPDDIAAKKIKEGVLVRVDSGPAIAPEEPEAEPAPIDAPVIEAETPVKEEPVRKAAPKRRKTTTKK